MKPRLHYLPLEAYRARYTELLSANNGWAHRAFTKKFDVNLIEGANSGTTTIVNGAVLDSVMRPMWAMQQVEALLNNYPDGQVYMDDFFHPGLEALPYSGRNYRAYAFCWAQTFDQYDFTRPMASWMRPWEMMAFAIYRKVFVASPLLQDMILTAIPGLSAEEVVCTGLPFDSANVKKILDPQFQPGPYDVVFSSRFDREKRPEFFLDLVERMPNLKFAVCTGHDELRGNAYESVARANFLANKGKLTIHAGLSKPEYYSVLRASKVQFNCSLQDWVAFTLLEAITHGCVPVYPCWRDFPIVFTEAPGRLYSPHSLDDAAALIDESVKGITAPERAALLRIVAYHDGSLSRIADAMLADQ